MTGLFKFNLITRGPSFRDKKLSDCFQLLLTKKPVSFDYVAIDATALVATALRLSKHVSVEHRRNKEVARHVGQNLQQFLRRIHCKKSLLVVFDGAEWLLKAHLTRTSAVTRRLESRLTRLPGTSLMQAVEERVVRMMPDRHMAGPEIVVSGTRVAGCIEEKITAWALDLACSPQHDSNHETLTMVGPSELFLNVMSLTPYFHCSSLVQHGADLRQMLLTDILEWLELTELAAKGDSLKVARIRTDALFLYIISNGCSATDLAGMQGGSFSFLYHRYCELNGYGSEPRKSSGTTPIDTAEKDGHFLFEDLPGNQLRLNLSLLYQLFQSGTSRMKEENEGRKDLNAESYLAHALHTHHLLCFGHTADNNFLPHYAVSSGAKAAPISTMQLVNHLRALIRTDEKEALYTVTSFSCSGVSELHRKKGKPHPIETVPVTESSSASLVSGASVTNGPVEPHSHHLWSRQQPLTAAEFTLLSYPQAHMVEAGLQQYVGVPPTSDAAKRIIDERQTEEARWLVQAALSFANPERPSPCLCFSPSYVWEKNEKTGVWSIHYIDTGSYSHEQEVRRLSNTQSGLSMSMSRGSKEGPAVFSEERAEWVSILQYPLEVGLQKQDPCTLPEGLFEVTPTKSGSSGAQEEGDRELSQTHQQKDAAGALSQGTSSQMDHKSTSGNTEAKEETLKILTWNVMFDRYSGQPTPLGMPGIDWCSTKRYPVLAKCIERENADVVGMQEVEPAFAAYLANLPWIRERYIISCTPTSAVLDPWGVLMLIRRGRFTLQKCTHVNVPAWSGHVSLMPIVSLSVAKRKVIDIAAVHLIAPFTKANESARTGQDAVLRQQAVKGFGPDAILMGDFNDWPGNEFLMPPETLYRECWPLLHPDDAGKTMDDTNTFCQLKVEEMFFGRSDKVFLRSRRVQPVASHLVGTKSVNEENENSEAPAYLFPSDHYGVSMTFSLSSL